MQLPLSVGKSLNCVAQHGARHLLIMLRENARSVVGSRLPISRSIQPTAL